MGNVPSTARQRAVLDSGGRCVEGDPAALIRIGLDPAKEQVRLPNHRRQVWAWSADESAQYRIRPHEDGWILDVYPVWDAPGARVRRLHQANLAAIAASDDLDGTVRGLARQFTEATGLVGTTLVLIDPSGAPTFAGGAEVGHAELAAMERCRRNGAPMAIWQAFEEDRVIVAPEWFRTARTDRRFAPITEFFVEGIEGVYVTIPLRADRGVIGVVSGMWSPSEPIDAATIGWWQSSADCLAVALQYSEVSRRAYLRGSVSARTRLNDDLHSTVAQQIFALSFEVARLQRGDASPSVAIAVLRDMIDRLVADVRAFIEAAHDGIDGPDPIDRLDELAHDAGRSSGATVEIDHRVGWGAFSSAFLDDVVRIVGEALRNSVKHAAPSRIGVRSWADPVSRAVVIEVSDDGTAEPGQSSGPSTGVGLNVLSELAERHRGSVTLTRPASGGAVLTVRLEPDYESEWAVAQRTLASPGVRGR